MRLYDYGPSQNCFKVRLLAAHLGMALEVVPVSWRIESCDFPEAGLYYVQVYFGSKLANERILVLEEDTVTTNGREEP